VDDDPTDAEADGSETADSKSVEAETADADRNEAGTETGDADTIPDADGTARATAAERTESDGDVDDELAGSIPFRDDDTETMNTVLSEGSAESDDESVDDESADDESADDESTDDEPTEGAAEAGDEGDGKEGGFFSRLLGR